MLLHRRTAHRICEDFCCHAMRGNRRAAQLRKATITKQGVKKTAKAVCCSPVKEYKYAVFVLLLFAVVPGACARDFLTDTEITKMQRTQDIDKRTGIYMDAASLRLRAALDRFEGKESEPGDAMEFYSQQDMLDDYYKIMERVMLVVGDAFESPRRRENINIKKALQTLKSESSGNLKRLSALMKLAEEKRKEEVWDKVNRAIDITGGVLDGAEEGLSILAERERQEKARRR